MSQVEKLSYTAFQQITNDLGLKQRLIIQQFYNFALKGGRFFKAMQSVADDLGCKKRCVQLNFRKLEENKVIKCVEKRHNQTWLYELTDHWKEKLNLPVTTKNPSSTTTAKEPFFTSKMHPPRVKITPEYKVNKRSKRITTTVREKVKNPTIALKELFKQSKAPEEVKQIVEAENLKPHRENAPLCVAWVWAKYLAHHIHKKRTPRMDLKNILRTFEGWCERERVRSKSPKKPRYASKTRGPRQSQQQVWENKANAYMQRHYDEPLVLGGPFG